jgi:hypothetical protein
MPPRFELSRCAIMNPGFLLDAGFSLYQALANLERDDFG